MKKFLTLSLIFLATVAINACTKGNKPFDAKKTVTVISREDGSGTRGAFIELFKVEEKAEDGSKKDKTTKEAVIANKTDIMLTSIANDPYAIGYVSLGSLNDKVKALSIDGVPATSENVKNNSYKIARPFILAAKSQTSEICKDFLQFILSKEGQTVVSNGYIAINSNAAAFSGKKLKGKLVVAGSSSVTPIMEKLKEAYIKVNPDAVIEIQMSDSTAGMTAAINGTCDIGMASRDLKDSETKQLTGISIALDGIAIIVNTANPLSNLTSGQVKNTFTGNAATWNEVNE